MECIERNKFIYRVFSFKYSKVAPFLVKLRSSALEPRLCRKKKSRRVQKNLLSMHRRPNGESICLCNDTELYPNAMNVPDVLQACVIS